MNRAEIPDPKALEEARRATFRDLTAFRRLLRADALDGDNRETLALFIEVIEETLVLECVPDRNEALRICSALGAARWALRSSEPLNDEIRALLVELLDHVEGELVGEAEA